MIYLDIETRSERDLKKSGTYAYAEDGSTEVTILGYAVDEEPVRLETDPCRVRELYRSWAGQMKCAHNCAFDRTVLNRFCGVDSPPMEWEDTMALAAEHGYPRSLANLALALGVEEKDQAGTRLINLFAKPRRGGGFNDSETHPEQWREFLRYAEQDVETLRQVYRALPSWPTDDERELWVADQEINDRGIPIDLSLAAAASEAGARNQEASSLKLSELLRIDNPRSTQQVLKGLGSIGLELENLQAGTIKEVLGRPDLTQDQRRALELRQQLALSSGKKFDTALLTTSSDGRARGTLGFYRAVSGRWGGTGIQPQNFTRAAVEDPEATILDLLLGQDLPNETLKALVRPMIQGPMTVVDFSAIEARVLAWLAGEQWVLDAFAAGRDIYVETGKRMGIPERQHAKAAVLGCGFGGGIQALKNVGAPGTDQQLQELVDRWREANPRIVGLWGSMEHAMWSGGRAGRFLSVEATRGVRRLRLPSGRCITYRGVHTAEGKFGRELRYRGDRGVRTLSRMVSVENPTQAIARDLLGHALLQMKRAGWRVLFHCHDEIIVEGRHSVKEVSEMMCDTPPWAAGLPVAAEGYQSLRYRK